MRDLVDEFLLKPSDVLVIREKAKGQDNARMGCASEDNSSKHWATLTILDRFSSSVRLPSRPRHS